MVQVDNKEGGPRIFGTITNIGNQEVRNCSLLFFFIFFIFTLSVDSLYLALVFVKSCFAY